jgi:enterochelin esterase-like enzyme
MRAMRRRHLVVTLAVVVGCLFPDGAHATTLDASFASKSLGGPERYAVYLPPGYSTSGRRYAVIYALHGLPSAPDGYSNLPIWAWGRIAQAAGRPAIVVAPQGARRGDSDPEWHDWGPGRDWESDVAEDLVEQIDRTYRTIPDRRHRALIGLSAGGYGATLIGLRHLNTFSVIESWSGYFHPTNPAGTAPLDVGSPALDAAADAFTYVPLLNRWFDAWPPTYFGFYVGEQDWRFRRENQRLHRALSAAGVAHRFAVYAGGHSYAVWKKHQRTWIRRAVRELAD